LNIRAKYKKSDGEDRYKSIDGLKLKNMRFSINDLFYYGLPLLLVLLERLKIIFIFYLLIVELLNNYYLNFVFVKFAGRGK